MKKIILLIGIFAFISFPNFIAHFDLLRQIGDVAFALTCGDGILDAGEECDDGNTISGDCCDVNCQYEPAGSSCADGQFCNGEETCNGGGNCQAGIPPGIDDGVACTDDSCDDVNDTVVHTPNDGLCDNGQFCDGVETCDAVNDCQAGTAPSIAE
jgi:cysteine-rich repeat protein